MASKKKSTTPEQRAQLKKFRHEIAILKRKGIVSKKVDARGVKPTPKYNALIREFRGVIDGHEKSYKLGAKAARDYKDKGYAVHNGRIALGPGAHVVSSGKNKGMIRTSQKIGKRLEQYPGGYRVADEYFKTLVLPIHPSRLDQLFNWIDEHSETLDKKLKSGRLWSFRFYGNNSLTTFENIDLLLRYLERYSEVTKYLPDEDTDNDDLDMDKQSELINAIEIGQVVQEPWVDVTKEFRKERAREKMRKWRAKHKEWAKNNPKVKSEIAKLRERERSKAYRAGLTKEQKAAYNAKGVERATASRNKRKSQ